MEQEKQLSRTWISCNYGYPIVVRNELQDTVDEVWVVYTSESIQIDRLMEE